MVDNKWYNLGIKEVLKKLDSSQEGLKDSEAKKRLEKFGYNELERYKKINPWQIFFSQFKNLLVIILFFATFLSIFIGEIVDAILISIIILILTIIGFLQEYRAEKTLEALRRLGASKAMVIRNGKEIEIDAKELVPGDVILLDAGDKVPADARIIESISLELDDSMLTGESVPVSKVTESLKHPASVQEINNMAFMGTVVTNGRGKAIVTDTGMRTEMGKIAKIIQVEDRKTPLKVKLTQLSKQLAILAGIIATVIFILGVYRGENFYQMLLVAVALAVSAIPEALPLIVTVTLATGVYRMAKKSSIIRKLPAVETLGSATLIACDKTGTLTKNEMTVQEIYTDKIIKVSGTGYKPEGEFFVNNKEIDVGNDEKVLQLLKVGTICNNAKLENDIFGHWWVIGSPTEGALLTLARKTGVEKLRRMHPLIAEIPFNSKRKMMTTINEENGKVAYTKGAPELVLDLCKLKKSEKEKILKINEEMTSRGLRVLALAYRKLPDDLKKFSSEDVEKNMNFLGLVGIVDPIREEAKNAVNTAKNAGIRVVIITGDHKMTTLYVTKKLGIKGEVLNGDELHKMSDEELEKAVEDVNIYTRASPEDKLRIVKALQKGGHVVAMTGDGVNDAPALKSADIGVAMGIKGTEVAKEASDMILVDDNFKSIVSAVNEGRKIYDNIKKATLYLLSTAIGEVLLILTAFSIGLQLPLLAIQILWINIVTEGIPAIGFAFEREEPDTMKRKPRNPKEGLINKELLFRIIGLGVLMAVGSLLLYMWYYQDLDKARTMTFTTLVMFELFNMFNCRSLRYSSLKIGLFSNKRLIVLVFIALLLQIIVVQTPLLSSVFKIVPLNCFEWLICVLVGSSILILGEIRKSIKALNFLPF